MRALHNSRSLSFRDPYGAIQVGGAVRLAVDVWDVDNITCELRLWSDEIGEELLPMEAQSTEECLEFSRTISFDEARIVWYTFKFTTADGDVLWYGAREGRTGGEGELRSYQGPSFQMTVYKPRAIKPDWYRGGIVYQIFPDRFARGAEWRERVTQALAHERKGPGRALVEDWTTPVRYEKDELGRIVRWDFYGGTLSGIRENLSYLHDMGVTVIYLNPIFEAASNHRYDTADYLHIDPMLGDEEEFSALCLEAHNFGISIILDGVFNHTGCDSRYFNKYGNYDTLGAYQSPDSPYRSWYHFSEDGYDYSSWWGVGDLPDLNEEDPGYRELVFGKDGVIRHWLRAGASGWRLDVADELPDDFLVELKKAALKERPDALVLGEVWEDASNKISYGKLRRYFLGDELDCCMNYNLRAPLISYIMGWGNAAELAERIESMHENYPPDAFAEALNMLGTHDTERLLTILGGAPDSGSLSDEERFRYRLNGDQLGLAQARLWLAVLLQMTLPGVPSIYYGDEVGMEGYADPYNRGTFPWGHENRNCQTIYLNAINLRRTLPVLVNGDIEAFSEGEDIFGFTRTDAATGESATVLVNRSLSAVREVSVPMRAEEVDEVISGREVEVLGDHVTVRLPQLGSAVLYFHNERNLVRTPERGSGILAHITSIPAATEDGEAGTLGEAAFHFCDWLKRAGQRYWQILPVNPTDAHGSPYAGLSAFAGNFALVSQEKARARKIDEKAYQAFCAEHAQWLDPYATFMAIKAVIDDGPWQQWPEKYRDWSPELLNDPELVDEIEIVRRKQFEFQLQWDELRAYAHEQGIQIVGDMPMYVSLDSADVWAHRNIFRLNANGEPNVVAGTPPDAFSPSGQVWGNPVYDWDALRAEDYAWWMQRFARAFALYDYVRLDHFLGFSSFYAIPRDHNAGDGRWRVGPGRELFERAFKEFGPLPVIAEDLGLITPAIRALMASCGVVGMDVCVFADAFSLDGWQPAAHKIAYTSTHDTQTLLGWCAGRFCGGADEQAAHDVAQRALEVCEQSSADVVMVQLQDALGLGEADRMNRPGTVGDNWKWRAKAAQVESACERMREVTERANRL